MSRSFPLARRFPVARRHSVVISAVLSLCAALLAAAGVSTAEAAAPSASTDITVDGASPGRTFDGVGAISGGGGNSRLLADYPEAQRGQILDYLFKPGYGAALQILKVEIGGDTNSTDGAESSIEHERGAINCDNGYQWWLMEQARARNPHIDLAALSWGAPGWIGDGNFWSQDMIDYIVSWLGCAKQHGLTVQYIGGWNERGYDASWYKKLDAELDAKGYGSVKIVGADSGWEIATEMRGDAALNSAVDIIGAHYPCGYLSDMTTCSSSADARATGKPLWASENGSQDMETGAAPMARAINRGYIDAKMTSFINWPVVAALPQNQWFNTVGLVRADEPGSGAYTVSTSAWATAQTTQFTAPGWQYLDTSSGYLAGDRGNGSYVTYASPDRKSWSTVLETTGADAPQTVRLSTAGGLPGSTLHVWSTDLAATSPRMSPGPDLTASGDGTYTLALQPGRVYTVTTTSGQGAGTATGPDRKPLGLPYSDTFATYGAGREAKYFASMNGAFETATCAGGREGRCLRQMASTTPIRWTDESAPQPYTMMGDPSWSNYTVATDVLLEKPGSVDLLGRVGTQGRNNNGLNAYRLRLSDTGAWSVLKSDVTWKFTTLASGTITAPGTGTWHRLSMAFEGDTITALVDGKEVGRVSDPDYGGGLVGLGTDGFLPAQFSRLSITPGTSSDLSGTYRLVNKKSGKVLDASGAGTADGTPVVQWSANGGTNQQWRLTGAGDGFYTLTGVGSGRVLDVPKAAKLPGTALDLWSANGGTNQQWLIAPSDHGTYTIEARSSGDPVDVTGASEADGAAVTQWPRNGGTNQQWQLVAVK